MSGDAAIHVRKGKFHAEMIKTTPRGSETISAEDGYVVMEAETCASSKRFW